MNTSLGTSGPTSAGAARTKTRRPRLDHETVLQAAEDLVDRSGYDALSMTLLAAELDTRVSSLYNHVANLRDLQAEVQVRSMQMLARQVSHAAMGRAGADGLHALSRSLRDFAGRYPQRYSALTRAPIDRDNFLDAASGVIDALGVMVRSTGLPEERILATGMAIFSALHGFVSLEASGYFGGVVDDLDTVFEQVVRGAVSSAVLEGNQPVTI